MEKLNFLFVNPPVSAANTWVLSVEKTVKVFVFSVMKLNTG